MIDRLHPAARSLVVLCVIAPLTSLLGGFVAAVLQASGASGVDWAATTGAALDTASVVLATGVATFLTLYVTPLTTRYGVGSNHGDGA